MFCGSYSLLTFEQHLDATVQRSEKENVLTMSVQVFPFSNVTSSQVVMSWFWLVDVIMKAKFAWHFSKRPRLSCTALAVLKSIKFFVVNWIPMKNLHLSSFCRVTCSVCFQAARDWKAKATDKMLTCKNILWCCTEKLSELWTKRVYKK